MVSNPWSWTKVANLIFLEQPAGVGFSYGTGPDELSAYNDYRASIDNLLTIRTFFTRFPERANQAFYVASESYGGHYIPQWTLQLFSDASLRKNFKGMLVGNAYTSYGALLAVANVLWGLQMIPQVFWYVACCRVVTGLSVSVIGMSMKQRAVHPLIIVY